MNSNKPTARAVRSAVEHAVTEVCGLASRGLSFRVQRVRLVGCPITRIEVWATLHFLPSGSPFCCGEPGCHLWLFEDRLVQVSEYVRRRLRLKQPVAVVFGDRIDVLYADGVEFKCNS